MEGRPGAALQQRGARIQPPVELGGSRQRGDAESWEGDLHDAGHERAAGCGCEAVAPQRGLDVADCEVGVEEGVEDWEYAEDGEGHADVGYYV